jgi:hypothetical protein
VDAEVESLKKDYLFNERLMHLADDSVLFMGFKIADHAENSCEKVLS